MNSPTTPTWDEHYVLHCDEDYHDDVHPNDDYHDNDNANNGENGDEVYVGDEADPDIFWSILHEERHTVSMLETRTAHNSRSHHHDKGY